MLEKIEYDELAKMKEDIEEKKTEMRLKDRIIF
jgi:hypothetical protein